MFPHRKKPPVTVKDIIISYLKSNGYDGLCNVECGCGVDDLFPCDRPEEGCVPAHKVECDPTECDRVCGAELPGSRCFKEGKIGGKYD